MSLLRGVSLGLDRTGDGSIDGKLFLVPVVVLSFCPVIRIWQDMHEFRDRPTGPIFKIESPIDWKWVDGLRPDGGASTHEKKRNDCEDGYVWKSSLVHFTSLAETAIHAGLSFRFCAEVAHRVIEAVVSLARHIIREVFPMNEVVEPV